MSEEKESTILTAWVPPFIWSFSKQVSVPSRARGSGDSQAWTTEASLCPAPNSEKGCGQITLEKEVPAQKASWELKAGTPLSRVGARIVKTPPRALEYSSLLWFSCLVSRPPRNLLLWAGNLACHLSVFYWFCSQTKDLKSICTIWVAWTSGLITGNFNIVPFYMNTAKNELHASTGLVSCEIKPEGHYALIKHNHS